MSQPRTATRLLLGLLKESPETHNVIIEAAGITIERSAAVVAGTVRLTLSEQLRLAEVAATYPAHRRQALRLQAQVLAAFSYERGVVDPHAPPSAERWERSERMRR